MEKQIARNKRQSIFLVFLMVVVFAILASAIKLLHDGPLVFILVGLLIYNIVSIFRGPQMILKAHQAQPARKKDHPRLLRTVENLSISLGTPIPKVYIIDNPAPNAFAAGLNPEKSIVGVTTGLLETMNRQELEGVIAHELGHIINYDIRLNMVTYAFLVAVASFTDLFFTHLFLTGGQTGFNDDNQSKNSPGLVGLIALGALILLLLMRSMLSREREYLADATGAQTTRYPEGLASALEKIDRYQTSQSKPSSGRIKQPNIKPRLATDHLFFVSSVGSLQKLLWIKTNTHPPISKRIKRLRNFEQSGY